MTDTHEADQMIDAIDYMRARCGMEPVGPEDMRAALERLIRSGVIRIQKIEEMPQDDD